MMIYLHLDLHLPLLGSSRLDLSNPQDDRPLGFSKDRIGQGHQGAAAPLNQAQA